MVTVWVQLWGTATGTALARALKPELLKHAFSWQQQPPRLLISVGLTLPVVQHEKLRELPLLWNSAD